MVCPAGARKVSKGPFGPLGQPACFGAGCYIEMADGEKLSTFPLRTKLPADNLTILILIDIMIMMMAMMMMVMMMRTMARTMMYI